MSEFKSAEPELWQVARELPYNESKFSTNVREFTSDYPKSQQLKFTLTELKQIWCRRPGSNQWHTDFQSAALPTELHRHWCCWLDSNQRPHPYQGCALPLELQQRIGTLWQDRTADRLLVRELLYRWVNKAFFQFVVRFLVWNRPHHLLLWFFW